MELIDGVQGCLNHGILYRDIHLNNIYRDDKGTYKIGDFGSCIWLSQNNDAAIGVGSKWYMVGPAGPRCEHVFRELYESASYAERGFLQLKVLELMLLLGRIPQERAADPYCSAEQTALAHHLRDHLLTNREGYVSLAQLAAEHAISVSHLQKLFKQTYGMPVYQHTLFALGQASFELP